MPTKLKQVSTKGSPPKKIKKAFTIGDVDPESLRGCASTFLTLDEAAAVLRVPHTTLKNSLNASHHSFRPELRDAWDEGVKESKAGLRRLMWMHANGTGPAAVNAAIHLSKFYLGQSEKSLVEISGPDGKPIQSQSMTANFNIGLDPGAKLDRDELNQFLRLAQKAQIEKPPEADDES